MFSELDARVSEARDEFSGLCNTHLTMLPGIGHSAWEARDKIAEPIIKSLAGTLRSGDAVSAAIPAQRRKDS